MTGLVEELMSLPAQKDAPEDKFGAKYKSGDGWAMVRATWDDINHISEDDKKQLRKGFAAYEADARTYGMPVAGHGRIFPYQAGDITYNEREVTINESWPHLVGIDIGHGHGRDPSAVVQACWDEEKDIIYIRRCYMEPTDTTREMARLIVKADHESPVAFPPDANRTAMNSPLTVAQQLRELNINLLLKPFLNPKGADGKRNNHKMPGITHINERFAERRLLICDRLCKQLLGEIEQYSYTDTGKVQDGKDHCIDAFRYAVMSIIQGFGQPLRKDPWGDYEDENEDYHFQSY